MPHSIDCHEFLARYSDYRDGRLHGVDQLLLESHLTACPRCQRYDAQVARGVIVLKNSREIEPSRRLRRNVHERIAAGHGEFPLLPTYVGVLATLTLIVSVGLVLWDEHEAPIPTIVMDSAPSVPAPASLVRPATLQRTEPPVQSLAVPAFGADWRAPGAVDETYLIQPILTR